MTRKAALVWASGSALVVACALAATGVAIAQSLSSTTSRLSTTSASSTVPPGKGGTPPSAGPLQPGEIRYVSEGVSLLPAAAGVTPAYSEADALAAFRAQPPVENEFAQAIAALQPEVQLMNVSDTQPADGNSAPEQYLGWVIIYHGVPPVFYGGIGSSPPPSAASMACDLVGIQNAQTGQWGETFESCA